MLRLSSLALLLQLRQERQLMLIYIRDSVYGIVIDPLLLLLLPAYEMLTQHSC